MRGRRANGVLRAATGILGADSRALKDSEGVCSGVRNGDWLEGRRASQAGTSRAVAHTLCLQPCRALGLWSLTCLLCLPVLEVLLDPCRTWCPASTCQAVCQLQEMGLQTPQLVQCKACDLEFCSACRASWHPGQGCTETMPITFLPGETSSAFKLEEDDAPIKRCPKCKVYIERDEGCAQMMCKNCKHAFCWYCLESLDVSTASSSMLVPFPEVPSWSGEACQPLPRGRL
nr:E3 ubiquitin-protein ligase RNF144A-like [Manis javanica]